MQGSCRKDVESIPFLPHHDIFCSNSTEVDRTCERYWPTQQSSVRIYFRNVFFTYPQQDTVVLKFGNRVCWTSHDLLNFRVFFPIWKTSHVEAHISLLVSPSQTSPIYSVSIRLPFSYPLCHIGPEPSRGGYCVESPYNSWRLLNLWVWFQSFDCCLTIHNFEGMYVGLPFQPCVQLV